jgi:hypothetical protein
VLQAAVDFAECALGLHGDGACYIPVGQLIELDAERASSSRSVKPVYDATAGRQQRHHEPSAAGSGHAAAEQHTPKVISL